MKTATRNQLKLDEGAIATCVWCGEEIHLDVTEGGGDPDSFGGWDWGSAILGSFDGMDYGCGDNPESDEDGVGGHSPIWQTIHNA